MYLGATGRFDENSLRQPGDLYGIPCTVTEYTVRSPRWCMQTCPPGSTCHEVVQGSSEPKQVDILFGRDVVWQVDNKAVVHDVRSTVAVGACEHVHLAAPATSVRYCRSAAQCVQRTSDSRVWPWDAGIVDVNVCASSQIQTWHFGNVMHTIARCLFSTGGHHTRTAVVSQMWQCGNSPCIVQYGSAPPHLRM